MFIGLLSMAWSVKLKSAASVADPSSQLPASLSMSSAASLQ